MFYRAFVSASWYTPPKPPPSFIELCDHGIQALENARELMRLRNAPIHDGPILEAVKLAEQLAALPLPGVDSDSARPR